MAVNTIGAKIISLAFSADRRFLAFRMAIARDWHDLGGGPPHRSRATSRALATSRGLRRNCWQVRSPDRPR
jgi:hypothetical protein